MSGTNNCLATISAAVGRALSHQEILDIATEVEGRIQARVNAGQSRFAAAAAASQQLAGEELLAAINKRQSAAINARISAGLDARSAVPGQEFNAVQALLTGARGVFYRAAASIDAARHALRDSMAGGLIHDLRQSGLLDAVTRRDKTFDHDVAVELWAVRDPTSARPTNNAQAVSVARIIDKYLEALRGQLNDAGAWIGRLDNYIVRQSHDQLLVRGDGSAAAFQAWRDMIEPRLDPRTFDGIDDRARFLRNVWEALASGEHETTNSATLAGFAGPGSLAKRVSQERVLHFRDADAWWEYNEKFGHGAVIDTVFHTIEKNTRDLALMRALGTNPEAMYQGWIDRMVTAARDRGDFDTVDKLRGKRFGDTNARVLDVLTGKADLPAGGTLAKIGSGIRMMESLAKLGGVVLSSIPDLAVNAAMLRHNGIGLFDSYARQMMELLPKGNAPETRAVAEQLGVGLDHMLGQVMHRFQAEDGAMGKMSAAARMFYKLSGLTYWTDSLKSSAGLMLANNLAERVATGFADLPPLMRNSLTRYGIDAGDWASLAAERQIAADGRHYILPAEMADRGLAGKIQSYITDQVREGMTEPTAYNRAFATFGTQRGTMAGELVRLMMQFKQYTVTYLDRSVGRELSRDGLDPGGIAHLIVATTALGYLSMTLKELAKGREPRSPEHPGDYAKLVMAAMTQGGGLGIYGDFLFGEANRMGGGAIATLAGPAAGTLEDVHKVLMSIRDQTGHPWAEGINLVKNNAPFINLFYSRMALDHLIMFRAQEWANPGYLRRYEQRVRKENAQTFWLSPSTFAH